MELMLSPWMGQDPPIESELRRRLAAEGFDVMTWSDPPHRAHAPHRHQHDESLWCLCGLMTFRIEGRDYRLGPGDRLMLPRGTVHAAAAGADGATYLIGEKTSPPMRQGCGAMRGSKR